MHRKLAVIFLSLSLIFSLLILISLPVVKQIRPFIPHLNYLLGTEKPTSYLILLGNDAEMRANGGFAGSYVKISLSTPVIPDQIGNLYKSISVIPDQIGNLYKLNIDLSFQDIYVPNGQLDGYVAPPLPVQQAFQHGSWELANADWEPDFPTAASSLRWFFEKGNEIIPDNLAILNLTTIKKILDVVGSFEVTEYQATLTPDNLYLFLQGKAEMNFFPGSTQKKDALTAVGLALKDEILTLPLTKKIKIAQILYQDLKNQNIVVNSTSESFQNFLVANDFAGKITSTTPDTYLFVETNLGANKSSAYVTRQTNHIITFGDNVATHSVAIKLENSSTEANPNPPFFYGGNYIAYFRIYIPENAQNIRLDREAPTQEDKDSAKYQLTTDYKYGLSELGFWQTTFAQNQSTINLSYTIPVAEKDYSLTILKQHGMVSSPQTITTPTKKYFTNLTSDFSAGK